MGDPSRETVPVVLRSVIGRFQKATSAIRQKAQRLSPVNAGDAAADTVPDAAADGRGQARPHAAPTDGGADACPELVARLTGMRWIVAGQEPPTLRISGFAYRRECSSEYAVVEVSLEGPTGSVRLPTRQVRSELVNVVAGERQYDHSNAAFEAELDTATLPVTADIGEPFDDTWPIKVSVIDEHGERSGRIGSRDAWASAGDERSVDIGDGRLARPRFEDRSGLVINVVRRHAVAEELALHGTKLEAVVRCRGDFVPRTGWLRLENQSRSVQLAPVPGMPDRQRIRVDLAGLADLDPEDAGPRNWLLQLEGERGARRYVHWQGQPPKGHRIVAPADERIAIRFAPNGVVKVDVHPRWCSADAVAVDPERLTITISGECHGVSAERTAWYLTSGRVVVPCDDLELVGGRFTARFGLRTRGPWSDRDLPLPQGGYRLRVKTDGADTDAVVSPELAESLGDATMTAVAEVRAEQNPKKLLHLRVRPPMPAGELGKYNQRRFAQAYRTARATPEDAVYFESFSGRSANDNTLAIYRELARRRPDLRLRWGVSDLSIDLPPGAEPVLMRGSQWWDCMANSRFVVTNCWMMTHFERRPHQRVLQSWHGTPLKLLGFDRIRVNRGPEYRKKTLREVAMWDLLISQNPYSTQTFRRAYGYPNEVLEIGYPRNDILSDPAADDIRAEVRHRLGLCDGEQVVLYVPTWREGAKGLFRELDFGLLVRRLGADFRLLVRGHSNTMRVGNAVTGRQVLDVTLYPDVSELYLAADVMITDYSSTMFDFSITGKPMIFFAPDLEQYSGSSRGLYFDLSESAPGPVLKTTEEVVEAVQDIDNIHRAYATAYAAWQRQFNPYDDGHAAERAVDALLG